MTTQLQERKATVNPKKFSLWLLLLGILMLFSGLTSAYIVRKGDGNWFDFELPPIFMYSTIIVLLSSLTMIWAYRAAKRDDITGIKIGLAATIILGTAFVISQYIGWVTLSDQGLHFVNPKYGDRVSASFLIAIAAIHLVHILAGIVYLIVMFINTFRFKIHKKNTLQISMCNTYWHFVGFLWVYLYMFLYFAPDF
ncbi:MAG: cytochrome c oxidase subunit 3 [Bacteroidia bacterium]|nr:cytochrome c oxidase subunit 3 [Bacteroidia bacterium]MDG2041554.1 cytochrome c oxidase subunit 3 [Bacteroidia bacterium]|tara:strand:- start:1104 stop:1691 length:588 start_codon:yes stop_codon:yes gene_type:complete